MKIRYLMVAVLLAVSVSFPIFAESVFLKSGTIIEGKILKETDGQITLSAGNGSQQSISRKDVLRVLYHTNYKTKMYITKTDGTDIEVYVVDENSSSYTYREDLNASEEIKISKDDVESISKKRPVKRKDTAEKSSNDVKKKTESRNDLAGDNGIGDLMYMPSQGTWYLKEQLYHTKYSYDDGSSGVDNGLWALFGYGLSNTALLSVSEQYSKFTSSDDYVSKGFYDPTFSIRNRFMNSSSGKFDVTVSFSPKLISATYYNNGRGGYTLATDIEYGLKFVQFSYSIFAGIQYSGKRTIEISPYSYTVTGGNYLDFGMNLQYTLTPEFLLRGGYSLGYLTQEIEEFEGESTTIAPTAYRSFFAGVGYVVSNRCALFLDLSYETAERASANVYSNFEIRQSARFTF